MDHTRVETLSAIRDGAIAPRLLEADDAGLVHPAVCFVVVRGANGQEISGSGWVFGRDTIVTARHVIESSNVTSVTVFPGRQGAGGRALRATATIVAPRRDYGALFVSESVADLSKISLGAPDVDIDGLDVTVFGYLEREHGDVQRAFDVTVSASGELLGYSIPDGTGLSGGPVLTRDRTLAVGIHIQDTGAERIDSVVARDLVAWASGNRAGARSLTGIRRFDLMTERALPRVPSVPVALRERAVSPPALRSDPTPGEGRRRPAAHRERVVRPLRRDPQSSHWARKRALRSR
jgi:hypothetical protein